MKSDKQSI